MWARFLRWRRFGPALLLVAVCGVLVLHTRRYFPFISDDALISLRYARRFARGDGLTWTDHERVEGYTNFLWVVVNAACGRLGLDLVGSARVLGTVGVLAAVVSASWAPGALAVAPVRLLSGGLFLALAAPMAVWAIGGLEQGFLAGMLAGALFAISNVPLAEKHRLRATLVAGGLLGAVTLLRADGILLAAAAAVAGGLAIGGGLTLRSLRTTALLLAPPLGLLALQLLFRLGYYGTLVPNTALAKVSLNWLRIEGGFRYVRDGYRPLLPALGLTLAVLAVGGRRLRAERWLPALAVLLAWSAYVALVGGDIFPGWRQLVPAVVALGFLLAEGAQAASERVPRGPLVVVPVSVAVLGAGFFAQCRDPENVRASTELWERDGKSIGHLLQRAFGKQQPLLAVDAAGSVPFWSDLPSLDMLGLNDRYIALHRPPTFGKGGIGHELGDGAYVLRRRPDIVLFNGAAGEQNPIFLSGRQMVATGEFQSAYQLVRVRGQRGTRAIGELWIRREGSALGVVRDAERIAIPGYFFATGAAVAELDPADHLVTRIPAGASATLPHLDVAPGTWHVSLDPAGASGTLAFRCDGTSATLVRPGGATLLVEERAKVDMVVGAPDVGAEPIQSARVTRSTEPAAFRCAKRGERLEVPLAQLSQPKPEHTDWAAPGNVLFGAPGLAVALPQPARASRLELSADNNDQYVISFFRGARLLGQARRERVRNGGGLAIQVLDVPLEATEAGFDLLELAPLEGDGYYSVGHLALLP